MKATGRKIGVKARALPARRTLRDVNPKYLRCRKCNREEVEVAGDAHSVTCWKCTLQLSDPDGALLKQSTSGVSKESNRKPRRRRRTKAEIEEERYQKGLEHHAEKKRALKAREASTAPKKSRRRKANV